MTSGAWVLGLGLALALGAAGARAQEVLRKQYDDGSIYEGTFKDGRQDGTGTYKLPNGFEYTGDWVAGEIAGTGKATYPNGSFYVGQFAKGKPDGMGKMNQSVIETGGEVIVVSQFTLHASTKKGNRPSFLKAAIPEISRPLYEQFCTALEKELGKPVGRGVFGANMKISLVNDGPVTILIDSRNRE